MNYQFDENKSPDRSGLGRRWGGISWLNRDLMWLFLLRVLRSLSQGYLGIILPLYLVALGYGAEALGLLLAVSAVEAAVVSTVVGLLADRFGRKPLLVVISLLLAFGAFGFSFAHSFVWIVAFAAIGSIGRGGALAGGAWGPFYPAVQALVAEHASDYNRTTVFGAFSFVGVVAGAVGSALAALPSLLRHFAGIDELTGYRILFVATGVLGVAMALAVFPINENRVLELELADELARQPQRPRPRQRLVLGLSPNSWRLVVRFMITNATNGLAIGMLGPIVVYWFYRRFGVNSAQLAGVFFAINMATAIPYLMAGRLALWMGSVRSVVATRAVSTVLMFAVVLMPTFALAALVYGIRAVFNVLSIPVRQSYLMGVIDPAERSSASGLASFPSQVTSAVGPYMAGYFMEHLMLSLPLEFAAVMQGLNTVLFYIFFRNVHPPEELNEREDRKQE
ncbi:MFS transporter [Candidatus Binatus sp.]|uniref:MFS transporter n=1 Tax=Candidatus Binatus sp. TaxID=2811406 RepID=UPI002F926B73